MKDKLLDYLAYAILLIVGVPPVVYCAIVGWPVMLASIPFFLLAWAICRVLE